MGKLHVGIITIYPTNGPELYRQSGVASYSKNLNDCLHNYCSTVVFAEKLCDHNVPSSVQRCWSKGFKYPFQIFKAVSKSGCNIIHIQYETYLFGGFLSAFLFPFLLVLLKFTRRPIILTMHGVIPCSSVTRQFLKENRIKGNPLVLKLGLIYLIKCISYLSTCIIVHENKLADILKNEYFLHPSKVKVIPHGIEAQKVGNLYENSKAKLGISSDFVILFFGFVTGYKNLELMIDCAEFIEVPNWKMLIAGGAHPRLGGDINYINYLKNLRERAAKTSKNILFKGFVQDSDIATYFYAADIVVFPYNACISASGPLSLAAAYERPIIVSSAFKGIISSNEIIFNNNPKDLAQKINQFYCNDALKIRAIDCIKCFKAERSWDAVAKKSYQLYLSLLLER